MMRPELCKDNYAAYDKEIMPTPVAVRSLERRMHLLFKRHGLCMFDVFPARGLDKRCHKVHNYYYILIVARGGRGARQRPHPRLKQMQGSPARGCPEPAPARCDASAVSSQRILRCAGSGPGQVRDATRGPGGKPAGESVGSRLRFLAAVVLSGPSGFHTGGALWIGPPQARTARRPQAEAGSDGVCGRGSGRRAVIELCGTGPPHRRKIRLARASTKHRARAAQKKPR